MARLQDLSGQETCRILELHGFIAVHQEGSQRVMQKREPGTTTTVVVPLYETLFRGTMASIIRQSLLPRVVFEAD